MERRDLYCDICVLSVLPIFYEMLAKCLEMLCQMLAKCLPIARLNAFQCPLVTTSKRYPNAIERDIQQLLWIPLKVGSSEICKAAVGEWIQIYDSNETT